VFGDVPELYGVGRWSFAAYRSALIMATLRLHPGWGSSPGTLQTG
jgi:hypothetical protein